ncbi:hypothetical protein GCM10023085_44920 [Actinomadura viridis]|uniref:Uncharacterized protein n=1 Tax=Actinomadura viridis TaxID=58110 RepID=A0A931GRL9_9ACTN|nr:hypothetical protein [Actinomadura viridis]MBG6089854.1 hypothetical protein [Actinomadura viridis]
MRILAAVDRMYQTLASADAPLRQLKGVTQWRADIAAAVRASAVCAAPPGMHIEDRPQLTARGWRRPARVGFLHGTATHRAWVDLVEAIVACLLEQEAAADDLHETAIGAAARARVLQQPGQYAAAAARANAALKWRDAAGQAAAAGVALLTTENKIMRPVGEAIASVGAAEVAKDKHYHARHTGRR